MEIGSANKLNNLSFAQQSSQNAAQPKESNAFGIGSANQPEVNLSPQAQILQQNEQTQAERIQSQRQTESSGSEPEPTTSNDFVRVSSSAGSAAKNNLTAEQAAEVYQSIQDLL